MSPQPQYSDGGWETSSRFAYGPDERLIHGHVLCRDPRCDGLRPDGMCPQGYGVTCGSLRGPRRKVAA